jgi:hypothetical protein
MQASPLPIAPQPPVQLPKSVPPVVVPPPVIKKPIAPPPKLKSIPPPKPLPDKPSKVVEVIKAKPVAPPPTAPVKKPEDRWSIGAPPVKAKSIPEQVNSKVTGEKIVFEEKTSPPTTPVDSRKIDQIRAQYQQTTQALESRLASLQEELAKGSVGKDRIVEFQQVLKELMAEKERLSRELAETRKQLVQNHIQRTEKPSQYSTTPEETRATVKMVSPQAAVKIGIPRLTTQPNVATGIIRDSDGSLLPNMIVTVRDKEDVPVRALKTNRLGQFAASTPLANGVYFIEVEDPKKTYEFNRIEISLTNQVLPPLEITAVSQKDLTRQRLAHELFGDNVL